MEQFDALFFSVFDHYKETYKRKANDIALFYISMFHIGLLLFIGLFLGLFLGNMHVELMSEQKGWMLFIVVAVIVAFRNWMYYSGKKRKVLNTKIKKSSDKHTNIYMLWLLPIGCFALAFLIYQAY